MQTLIAGIVLLGALVFFHELGHFLVAKACGVRVLTFSIGFGPRIFGFKRGDTDYRISAIPLGGYVRMFGDDITEEIPESEWKYSFLHQKTLQKSAIAFAGPAANFILAMVIFFIMFAGSRLGPSATIETIFPDSPAALAGMQSGDTVVSIAGNPVRDFTDLQREIKARADQNVAIVVERDGKPIDLNLQVGGVWDLNPLNKGERSGRIGVMPAIHDTRIHVPDEGFGLVTGAKITSVDGKKVNSNRELMAALEDSAELPAVQIKTEDGAEKSLILLQESVYPLPGDVERSGVTADEMAGLEKIIDETRTRAGEEIAKIQRHRGLGNYDGTIGLVQENTVAHELGVQLGDRAIAVDGKTIHSSAILNRELLQRPDDIHAVAMLTKTGETRLLVFRLRPENKRGRDMFKTFGALASGKNYATAPLVTTPIGAGEALEIATRNFNAMFMGTLKGMWMLATFQVNMSSLGGPLTIVDLAGRAAEMGLDPYLRLMCFISINLGILNLLPIPVLDGGHLLMFLIEAIQRKPLSLQTKMRAIKVGFSMLALLMVVAIFNDFANFFSKEDPVSYESSPSTEKD